MTVKCGFKNSKGGRCGKPVMKQGDACFIHKAKKLEILNNMFKKELSTLHKKMQEYAEKLQISRLEYNSVQDRLINVKEDYAEAKEKLDFIDTVDLMKQQLINLSGNRPIIKTLKDRRLKDEIEKIVGVEFYRAKPYFYDLVDRRNFICHRHTMADFWKEASPYY